MAECPPPSLAPGAKPFKTGRSVEVTTLQDHGSIGRGRICITGYDPPYACACFRRYKPLRDASQSPSPTECPRAYFYVLLGLGLRDSYRGEYTRVLQQASTVDF